RERRAVADLHHGVRHAGDARRRDLQQQVAGGPRGGVLLAPLGGGAPAVPGHDQRVGDRLADAGEHDRPLDQQVAGAVGGGRSECDLVGLDPPATHVLGRQVLAVDEQRPARGGGVEGHDVVAGGDVVVAEVLPPRQLHEGGGELAGGGEEEVGALRRDAR